MAGKDKKKDDPYSKKAYKAWKKEESKKPYSLPVNTYDEWTAWKEVDDTRKDLIKRQESMEKELIKSGKYTKRQLLLGKGPPELYWHEQVYI